MILSCNSCEKKFVVPDNAISASGRLVQCSSCGNKWKQFPLKTEVSFKEKIVTTSKIQKSVKNNQKAKNKEKKKRSGPNLYSPEYLAKKHGIDIKKPKLTKKEEVYGKKDKIYFGFYNSLIFYIIIFIFLSKTLYFFQDVLVVNFPITEFYLNYFFENIRNTFEIIKNLITNY